MKTIVTLAQSQRATKRPWWQVRRTLSCALVVVCAAIGALFIDPEIRAALFAMLVRPLAEGVQSVLRSDVPAALAFSTGAGLLIGRMLRRLRLFRAPRATA